jgi:hypothetical protein
MATVQAPREVWKRNSYERFLELIVLMMIGYSVGWMIGTLCR